MLFRTIKKIAVLVFLCISLFRPAFTEAEEDLVSLIREVKPSIVAVGTYYFNDKPKVKFYGTGFVIKDGGIVVTNHHVINQIIEKKIVERLRIFHDALPNTGIETIILAEDKTHDLALLKIKGEKLPPFKLGDSKTAREGEAVAFTGYPVGLVLGLNPTTHVGIISAIAPILLPSPTARAIKSDLIAYLRNPYDIFQLDATAYPGNSGSPVYLRRNGQVIGVINMVFVKGKKEHVLKEPTGITYAIPIEHVKTLLMKVNQ
jgi:S1-C subfamily serine protease